MPLAAHRQVPNRARELRERAWALVEQRLTGVICGRCGCTYQTQGIRCLASLGEDCQGDEAIDRTMQIAKRDVGLLA